MMAATASVGRLQPDGSDNRVANSKFGVIK